jgi:hypothetical protein
MESRCRLLATNVECIIAVWELGIKRETVQGNRIFSRLAFVRRFRKSQFTPSEKLIH